MGPTRRSAHDRCEQGITLIETVVASALILVVMAMVMPQLIRGLTTFDDVRVRSDTTDQAQLAMRQIEHDVVSASVIYTDAALPSGLHLQSYSSGGSITCIEYQVAGGALQRRTKATGGAWPAATVGWSNLMSGVVNSARTPVQPVFAVPAASQYRSLVVTLWVNTDTRSSSSGAAAPTMYTTTVTGRAVPAADTSVAPVGTPC